MSKLDIKDSYVRDAIWFLAFMRRKRRRYQHFEVERIEEGGDFRF